MFLVYVYVNVMFMKHELGLGHELKHDTGTDTDTDTDMDTDMNMNKDLGMSMKMGLVTDTVMDKGTNMDIRHRFLNMP
jgi:hypothetical protein